MRTKEGGRGQCMKELGREGKREGERKWERKRWGGRGQDGEERKMRYPATSSAYKDTNSIRLGPHLYDLI